MTDAPPTPSRRRWAIAGMLMLLSVLNYVDRQALSILAVTIQEALTLSDREYGWVVQAFQGCYAVSYLAAGRMVDRVGPRLAEAAFVAWWSVANMLTGVVRGFGSLLVVRSLLGLGEPGHYAVAAKAVGRHFPPAERGLAVSLYTLGGTLGAALAAPLVSGLTAAFGWRAAFVVTGAAGLVFAAVWWAVYRDPPAAATAATRTPPPPLREILRWKALWLVVAVRLVSDPVWAFYLFWLPKYFRQERGFTLADLGNRLWVVYVAADLGCLLAGWAAGRLVRRGVSPAAARVRVMAACGVVLGFGFTVPLVPSAWAALALASLFAACLLAFLTAAVALPLDLFPTNSLGTVQGVIGTGGAVGAMLSTGVVAWAVTDNSYAAAFAGLSVLHPAAGVVLIVLLPRLTKGPPKP